MSEERLLILKMVEEGKITAQEAAALLEALGDSDPKGSRDQESGRRRLEKQGDEFAQKVEQAAERFSKSLESKLEGGLAEKLSNLPRILAKLPFLAVHEAHEFSQEFSGSFQRDIEMIPVKLSTVCGHIEVEAWDQEHYKLIVTQKIRGDERDAARKKQVPIALAETAEDMTELVVETLSYSDVTLSYHLYLPCERTFDLQLMTNNGRLDVANLNMNIAKVMTTNGSIRVRRVRANTLEVSSSNGSCKLEEVESKVIRQRTGNGSLDVIGSAEQIECVSTNGSIKVRLSTFAYPTCTMSLSTTNGSIKCALPAGNDLGVAVDAVTAVGKVQVDMGKFSYSVNEKRTGTHRISGTANGVSEEEATIKIQAKTSSGSIIVSQEEQSDGV